MEFRGTNLKAQLPSNTTRMHNANMRRRVASHLPDVLFVLETKRAQLRKLLAQVLLLLLDLARSTQFDGRQEIIYLSSWLRAMLNKRIAAPSTCTSVLAHVSRQTCARCLRIRTYDHPY
eukprot:6207144-Pleurochrysis_carterae.AAC.1